MPVNGPAHELHKNRGLLQQKELFDIPNLDDQNDLRIRRFLTDIRLLYLPAILDVGALPEDLPDFEVA